MFFLTTYIYIYINIYITNITNTVVLETKAIFEDTIAEIKIRLEKMEEELTQTSKDKMYFFFFFFFFF